VGDGVRQQGRNDEEKRMITGQCHCKAIRWIARFEPTHLVSCTCSLCHRYGVLWAHGTEASVAVEAEAAMLRSYVHGDRMIDFNFCGTCGCVTHYASRPGGAADDRVSVNMRMAGLDVVNRFAVRTFDGADTWAYLD